MEGRAHPGPLDAWLWTERGIYRPGETVNLLALLRNASGDAANVPLTLRLRRPNAAQRRPAPTDRENTTRSRSFFFIAAGLARAALLGPEAPLYVPENGVIGINVPVSPSRAGSLSTRTTHPFFMAMLRRLLDSIGILSFDAWRACRLVVDTGIHALGWSRQQAIDYMMQNTVLAQNNIENEVDRYITWPGQALAYKVGQLEILRLREEAKQKLGDRFDIKGFHDAVLAHGAVTMGVLDEQVRAWAASSAGAKEALP